MSNLFFYFDDSVIVDFSESMFGGEPVQRHVEESHHGDYCFVSRVSYPNNDAIKIILMFVVIFYRDGN